MTLTASRMSRARLFAVFDAIETDMRDLLDRAVVPQLGEDGTLGEELLARAHDRMNQDGQTLDTSRPLDYVDFQDGISLLNRHRHLLTTDLRLALAGQTPHIEKLTAIRNRVMHGRPLLADDAASTIGVAHELLKGGVPLPTLNDVMNQLADDPSWAPTFHAAPDRAAKVLHNLPLPDFDETGLVGRFQESREILKHLMTGRHDVLTLVGEGGIGKTALAVKVLYDLIDDPDCPYLAVLWTSLKTEALTAQGVERLASAAADLVGLVTALGRPIDADFGGAVDALASVLDGVPALIVVDNLETADPSDVIALYDALPVGTKFLFTSRVGLGELERRVKIKPLDQGDGVRLFRILARNRNLDHLAQMDDDRAARIVSRLRSSPLALKWYVLGVEAGADPDRLLDDQTALIDFCVRTVYESLTPEARLVLDALYLRRGPMTQNELALITEMQVDDIRRGIHQIQQSSLLEVSLDTQVTDRLAQIYALTESATFYIGRLAPPATDLRIRISDKLAELRVSEEQRQYDEQTRSLAPNVVRVRSEVDRPIAHLLRKAISALQRGDLDEADTQVARATQLDRGYFEVARVAGYLASARQQFDEATTHFEEARGLAGESRPFVDYYFAMHLLRAREPKRALELALDAHKELKLPDTAIVVGNAQTYLGQYAKARKSFLDAVAESTGRQQLVALTGVLEAARRKAESVAGSEDAAQVAQTLVEEIADVFERLALGAADRRLIASAFAATATALHAASTANSVTHLSGALLRLIDWTDRLAREWVFEPGWAQMESQFERLMERPDIPSDVRDVWRSKAHEIIRSARHDATQRVHGSVNDWKPQGYGFIRTDAFIGDLYFSHVNLRNRSDRLLISKGVGVTFVVGSNDRGPIAQDVATTVTQTDVTRILRDRRRGTLAAKKESYGFITDETSGASLFVHMSDFGDPAEWDAITPGATVEYYAESGARSPKVRPGTAWVL